MSVPLNPNYHATTHLKTVTIEASQTQNPIPIYRMWTKLPQLKNITAMSK